MSLFMKGKYQLVFMLILSMGLFSIAQVAEAKRFGMGKSFGYNKQVAPKSFNTAPTAKKPVATTPKSAASNTRPASGASKWLGPLAGIAAGGMIAAMLFGDGFEGIQLFDILLFALIAFVLFKLFARRVQPSSQTQSAYSSYQDSDDESNQNSTYRQTHSAQGNSSAANGASGGSIFGADLEDGVGQGVSSDAHYLSEIPAWFDEAGFVDGAKSHFLTLQKAWDAVDLAEIESYCTADLYQALQQELRGVQAGDNKTVVDSLDAEIAAMAIDGDYFVVSIRFSGFIEEDTAGAHAFSEVWHIRRSASDEGDWQVAGIQQGTGSL